MEGLPALRAVLEQGFPLQGVITLKPDLRAQRSGAADYGSLCSEYNVPLFEIADINDAESQSLLKELSLDLAFVIGWTQIVRPEILKLPKIGMIGAHASLLPHHRGRAPINWALIKGEKQTGNSLIWLDQKVDAGDIIDQIPIPVTPYDTCATIYERVAETNREMILRALRKIRDGECPGRPQPQNGTHNLPGRKPRDGVLDWSMSSIKVYDFIRALTRPYPGAFSWLDGKRWFIWQCALLPDTCSTAAIPGQIIGPIYSPIMGACGQVVACGTGSVALLELEDEQSQIVTGRMLSDQPWQGKVWTNE